MSDISERRRLAASSLFFSHAIYAYAAAIFGKPREANYTTSVTITKEIWSYIIDILHLLC